MKKRLLLSILSLLLSLAMLTGTTFAWFTDSVSSGRNRIVAGNLDIALYNGSTPVTENTLLFDEITYWEPGVVAWDNLTVANEGTLALSLQLGVVLTATQLPKEADSFGSDYDAAAGAVTRVTRDSQVLSNVKTDLPENSIAASRGVVFATAPYAYTDTALFAGKHIVKLGLEERLFRHHLPFPQCQSELESVQLRHLLRCVCRNGVHLCPVPAGAEGRAGTPGGGAGTAAPG